MTPTAANRNDWERTMRRVRADKPATQHVAFVLATWADPDGSRVRPGIARLVLVTRLSERTVRRALEWLRDEEFILKVKHGNRHAREADEYRLSIPSDIFERWDSPDWLTPDEKLRDG